MFFDYPDSRTVRNISAVFISHPVSKSGLGHWELAPGCYSFDFPLCISWRPYLSWVCLILLFQVSPMTTTVLCARWCSIMLLNEWMLSLFCSQLPWELLQVLCSQDSLKQLTQNAVGVPPIKHTIASKLTEGCCIGIFYALKSFSILLFSRKVSIPQRS